MKSVVQGGEAKSYSEIMLEGVYVYNEGIYDWHNGEVHVIS